MLTERPLAQLDNWAPRPRANKTHERDAPRQVGRAESLFVGRGKKRATVERWN